MAADCRGFGCTFMNHWNVFTLKKPRDQGLMVPQKVQLLRSASL
jgi:hypothetical protein